MKKKLMILGVMLLAVTASVAAVTFTWSSTYDNVTHYRYQFNTDQADNWITVGPYDTKRSYDSPAGTTLYVQQSIDGGKTWSKSAVAVYDPATVEILPGLEKAPAPAVVGPDPIPVMTEAEVAAKEEVLAAKKAADPYKGVKRSPRFGITFRIPSLAFDPRMERPYAWDQYAGVQVKANNVWSPNHWFGLHLAADVDFGMISATPGFPKNPFVGSTKTFGLDLALQASFLVAKKVDIFTGPAVGVDMILWKDGTTPVLTPCWALADKFEALSIFGIEPFRMGFTMFAAYDLGFEYNFNSVFSVGLNTRFKYWFTDIKALAANRFTVGANLGISFKF